MVGNEYCRGETAAIRGTGVPECAKYAYGTSGEEIRRKRPPKTALYRRYSYVSPELPSMTRVGIRQGIVITGGKLTGRSGGKRGVEVGGRSKQTDLAGRRGGKKSRSGTSNHGSGAESAKR